MSGDRLDAKVDALFRRYRRDAVLLHRLYPPHEGRANSKFGGLPNLPDGHEWPRTSRGTPLHFLAQIDCAEIGFPTPLPERGTFFFFGRDDDEQIWDYEPPASDDIRVIHALDAFAGTSPRLPPGDLPPIGGSYPRPAWRDFLREGEAGPNIHVEWPIRPLRIDTWPDPSAVPELHPEEESGWRGFLSGLTRPDEQEVAMLFDRYIEDLERRRFDTLIEATGEPHERNPDRAALESDGAHAIFDAGKGGHEAWPQHWIYIHYLARALLHRPESTLGREQAGELKEAAGHWLRESLANELDAPVPLDRRHAFRNWVAAIRHPKDERPLSWPAIRLIRKSAAGTIRAWAGDRERAALVPLPVYATMAFELGAWSPWGPQYSQMLGHAPSAQQALRADDPTICLLNLASDDGIGWMFGDVGNAAFWISAQDLARRDFHNVRATIEGH